MRRFVSHPHLRTVIAGCILAVVAGCTLETAPTALHNDAVAERDPVRDLTLVKYGSDQTEKLLADGLKTESTLITPLAGGRVVNGSFELDIPKNALTQNAFVTLEPTSAYEMIVRVEPTGLTFRPGTAARLTFNWRGTEVDRSPSIGHARRPVAWGAPSASVDTAAVLDSLSAEPIVLKAMWFNPGTSAWEPMEGGEAKQGTREFTYPLSHFSYYALAR